MPKRLTTHIAGDTLNLKSSDIPPFWRVKKRKQFVFEMRQLASSYLNHMRRKKRKK